MARCVSPITLNIPERGFMSVPCGKCNYCLSSRRDDWTFRLRQELKHSGSGYFVTLTYGDDALPRVLHETGEYFENGVLVKKDLQLYFKRLRKRCSADRLRYYACGEYGTRFGRPHYHVLLFGLPYESLHHVINAWSVRSEVESRGNVYVVPMNDATIHYTTKYVINRVGDYGGREPPFSLMSRRPGIGQCYVDTHYKWHRDDMRDYTRVNGFYSRLPRFYRDKLFDIYERMDLSQISQRRAAERELQDYCDRVRKGEHIRYEGVQRIVNHELIHKRLNEKNKL